MYPLIRDFLFAFDPEKVHYFSMDMLRISHRIGITRPLENAFFRYPSKNLAKTVFGLPFPNPVGLGAGFDKNAVYLSELEALGFGFVETGTITPKPQAGNDKPRLFRLPADKALINRMGFNNDGVDAIKNRLITHFTKHGSEPNRMIVGANIGKNKLTPNEYAADDYAICFDALHECADYFVVNVSSPNTPGLRALQEKEALVKIFDRLNHINGGKAIQKPILLKIAPDLTTEQLNDIVAISFDMQLSGLVTTNTSLDRSKLSSMSAAKAETIGMGGLSGKPIIEQSTNILRYLSDQTNHQIPIIASGGIFTGADAKEKIEAGASLIQVWTGFIYEGPSIVKNICTTLAN